ncbi:unannotated protein [freshwater metagenome]|uniref:histidine kinase n=1 Tax=freshwater metagenome TaxID=449393 RepID=A0A6J6ZAE0_9ZZZZ
MRVTLIATVVVAVALTVFALVLLSVLRAGLLRSLSGTGPERAAEVAALAGRGPLPAVLPVLNAPRLTLIQVIDANGAVVAASEQLRGTAPVVHDGEHGRRVQSDGGLPEPGPWLVEPTAATIANWPVTVVVLTSLTEFSRSGELLAGVLVAAVPLLVALASGVVWIVAGRSLRPVEQLRSDVEDISAHRLHRRVDVPPTRDEVGRLAATLNAMLDRLEDAHGEQRRFVADASHELRTPIANIRTALEVAAAHPAATDWPAVSADVLRQDDRLQRLADDLLFLARSDLGATARHVETVDLAALVRAETDRPVRGGVRLVLVEPLPAVTLDGDRDQLGRAVSNLLDNALRHATSTVSVRLHAGMQRVQIVVRDDGLGIGRDDRERIFDRFVRLDEGRARSDGGSGLGLAIVREIAQAHGGTVRVVGAEPGATLVLELPRPLVSQRSLSPRPPRSDL